VVLIPPNERHTIRGAGATMTTVDGKIQVDPGAELMVSDLGITGAGHGLEVRLAQVTAERVVAFANELTGFYVLQGRLDLSECTSSGNGFRGIHANDRELTARGRASHVRVMRSTVAGNAYDGIGVSGSRVRVEDSTISGNGSGGVSTDLVRNLVRIRRSTITGNEGISRGGGISVNQLTSLVLQSTIVAGNTSPSGGNDIDDYGFKARLRSLGFNLIGDPVGTEDMKGRTDLDLVGVVPMLDALADNGGPTETHALLPGSPAIELTTRGMLCREPDQRGIARLPAPCDAGAFEAP
jgi:hypothetical protein